MGAQREALRARRIQLGFSQESFAEEIGVSPQAVGEWERGDRCPRPGFRPRIARALHVTPEEAGRLIDNGEGTHPDAFAVPSWLGHLAALEQGASEVWTYEPIGVPGLLQTADYATVVESTTEHHLSDAEVDQFVQARLARQAVLSLEDNPLRLAVVIDESILYRLAGDRRVMASQLEHLATMSDRENVDLRVLTFDAQEFTGAFGSFKLFTGPGHSTPYMASVLDRAGSHYLDRQHELDAHIGLFKHLQRNAQSRAASRDLIHATMKDRYL
jgi:transcriptional regulator with XRE-family HTH domain